MSFVLKILQIDDQLRSNPNFNLLKILRKK